ncbi:hypothetical protein HHI36_000499 [Cryptolaemus montrouzieri]|uniref:RNA polymerase II-associated protein 3 n=1 Tax=Cryptolaemus montrouzieri TaxID=559131 RepID=A0ABD2P4Y5_9CUCU
MNPVLLQEQLKNNNKDLLDFCQDLKSWGEEMKEKEQKKFGSIKTEPPVMKKEVVKNEEKSDKPKEAKRKCVTYADWDKFDADKECEKIDASSDSDLTDEFDENMKEEALLQKDQGNRFVKNGSWDDAIRCYTKAIDYYAYDPVFYANRALCYLKKKEMVKAESDCTTSLKLDKTYVKAYQRRAAARESLNKLEEAKLDLLRVLEFEPKNAESLMKLEKLKEKIKSIKSVDISEGIQKPVSKFSASRGLKKATSSNSMNQEISKKPEKEIEVLKPSTIWPSGDKRTLVKAIKKPPHLRSKKSLKRITIKEINSAIPDSDEVIKENTSSFPKKDIVSNTIKSDDFKVVEHKSPINEIENKIKDKTHSTSANGKIQNVTCTEMNKEVKNLSNFDVIFKTKEQEVVNEKKSETEELLPPKNSVQFYFMWKRFNEDNKRYEYLKLIEPKNIPNLFKESLESKILSEILVVLSEYFIKEMTKFMNTYYT